VGSGLPLERALTALSDEAEDPKQRELVAHLRSEVNAGSPFASALASAEREFDDVYRGVVAAGEQSGALGQVLERLADDLEERQALKAKLIGATLYPAIVSLIAVLIVTFLVTYVVPQVASVFANGKHALPGLTVAMLAISAFVRHYGIFVLLVLGAGAAGLSAALRKDAFRERFDAAMLNLPLFGRLTRGYNAARFAGTLAMLAGAGVQGGAVHGASDERGFRPEKDATSVADFNTTIAAACGLPVEKEYHAPNGRPFKIGGGGRPIAAVLA
jgi:general secretion pathway protein F